jgi:hypothetical protein
MPRPEPLRPCPARVALAALCVWTLTAPAASGGEAPVTASDYLALLEGQREAVASFRGSATVKLYGPSEGTFNVAFGCVPPDRRRLEVSAPLAGTVAVVTAKAGDFLVYYPLEKVAYAGAYGDERVFDFPGGDVGRAFWEGPGWLAGWPPLYAEEVEAGTFELSVSPAGPEAVALTWSRASDGSLLQRLTLAQDPLRVLNARLYEDDEVVLDVTYDDWRDDAGFPTPFAISIKTEDQVAEVSLRKFEVNVPIEEEAFSTTPPEGTTILETWPRGPEDDGDD